MMRALLLFLCFLSVAANAVEFGGFRAVSHITAARAQAVLPLEDGRIFAVYSQTSHYYGADDGGVFVWNPRVRRWESAFAGQQRDYPERGEGFSVVRLKGGPIAFIGGRQRVGELRIDLWDPALEQWRHGPALPSPRQYATATALGDGSVLIAGGSEDRDQMRSATARTEIFDGTTVTSGPPMNVARGMHNALLLPDGSVMVTGGALDGSSTDRALASVERYDPVAKRWEGLPPMRFPRFNHAALAFPDGRVMVIGGQPSGYAGEALASVEIWNPTVQRWEKGPDLPDRLAHPTALRLDDGRILVAGGGPEAGALVLDATTGRWENAGWTGAGMSHALALPLGSDGALLFPDYGPVLHWQPKAPDAVAAAGGYIPRRNPALVPLKDGRLLVAGGSLVVQIWDPAGDRWNDAGRLRELLRQTQGVELPDGRVMVMGRVEGESFLACFVGTPAEGTWLACRGFPAEPEIKGRSDSQMNPQLKLLPDGRVLAVFNERGGAVQMAEGSWATVEFKRGQGARQGEGPPAGFDATFRTVTGTPLYTFVDPKNGATVDASAFVPPTQVHGGSWIMGDGRQLIIEYHQLSLWDPATATWTNPLSERLYSELGRTPVVLKDGCALTWASKMQGMLMFDLATMRMQDVGEYVGVQDGTMTVLADGSTVIVAGVSAAGEKVAGAFRRFTASCDGVTAVGDPPSPMPSGTGAALRRLSRAEQPEERQADPLNGGASAAGGSTGNPTDDWIRNALKTLAALTCLYVFLFVRGLRGS